MSEFKQCPFCGESPRILSTQSSPNYAVTCVCILGAYLPPNLWNTRVIDSDEEKKKMREALTETLSWITNWNPNFEDDPEWPATRAKIDEALSGAKGENS